MSLHTSASLPSSFAASPATGPWTMRVVRGRRAIVACLPLLVAICGESDQQGEADNLEYFLHARFASGKRPCLVLFSAGHSLSAGTPASNGPGVSGGYLGAALLFEYMVAGIGLGLYTSSDWTGRRNVLGRAEDRPRIAAMACRTLIYRGAHVVFTACHQPELTDSAALAIGGVLQTGRPAGGKWSIRRREFPLYLPLRETVDETLARIGQRTRSNLRYYRRRAEATLGCSFIPQVEMSRAEFIAFNRISSFAVSDQVAAERYDEMSAFSQPFFSGARAADGRWLSVVFGWRSQRAMELKWQVNRADLPELSLATVMRAYLIEYAISLGLERLYIDGGTKQAIQLSFVTEGAFDLILMRNSVYARLVKRFATRLFDSHALLRILLAETDLEWRSW